MENYIQAQMDQALLLKQKVCADIDLIDLIAQVSKVCIDGYKNNNRVFCAGNGGSAADAQHIAAEFVSRFYFDRPALAAEALTVNTSILTAIGNDYSYDQIFSRQIEANARPGDIFFAISTSGNSGNILLAIEAGKKIGMKIVGFTGETGGKMAELCDYCFKVPSRDTPRVQEIHILIGHLICAVVEREIFGKK
mgnify:CR=1 FL=1